MTQREARRDWVRSSGAARTAFFIGASLVAATVFSKALDVFLELAFGWDKIASAMMALLVVSAGTWFFLYKNTDMLNRLVRSEARELDSSDLSPRPYLVTGFSLLSEEVGANVRRLIPTIRPETVADLCGKDFTGTLRSWQQSLRMIHFLHNSVGGEATPQADRRLRKVVVIDNGTTFLDGTPQLALFIDLIKACFPGIDVRAIPHEAELRKTELRVDRVYSIAPDYETYEYVTTAFDHAFSLLEREEGSARAQVEAGAYIDVTPGTKVFSIAAAIQTLNRQAIFLYVTSDQNRAKLDSGRLDYLIFGYDADAQFDLAGRG